jgi:hypothetical protein
VTLVTQKALIGIPPCCLTSSKVFTIDYYGTLNSDGLHTVKKWLIFIACALNVVVQCMLPNHRHTPTSVP